MYPSDRLVPDADVVIRLLREQGGKVTFLSNKPVQPREEYGLKLMGLGIPTDPAAVISSTPVMANGLKKHAPKAKLCIPCGVEGRGRDVSSYSDQL